MLHVPAALLSKALVRQPKVLGYSLAALEDRVQRLGCLLGSHDAVAQLVLQEPSVLTWAPQQLRKRLTDMAACLGIAQPQLLLLIQQQPRMLPASHFLRTHLKLLQQLICLAGGSNYQQTPIQSPQHLSAMTTTDGTQQQEQQHLVAARAMLIKYPQLMLRPPEALQSYVAAAQAQSGMSMAQVAAVLVQQPHLMLAGTAGTSTGNHRTVRQRPTQQQQQQMQGVVGRCQHW
eukprot:gene8189-8380_t